MCVLLYLQREAVSGHGKAGAQNESAEKRWWFYLFFRELLDGPVSRIREFAAALFVCFLPVHYSSISS